MNGNGNYSFSCMMEDCKRLVASQSSITAHEIGRSVLGKPLIALRCGRGPKRVQINASFHANEWITSALLMKFLGELSEAYSTGGELGGENVSRLCAETTLWGVPMVNPDGVELAQNGADKSHPLYRELLSWNGGLTDFTGWKANVRGIDLNDQFPAFWEEECKRRGVGGPAPRDYPGPYPLSEPEAAAIAAFTDRLNFHTVVALHTQGREIYWNYREFEPPEAEALARRLANASGYAPVKLSGSDAGFKDWFIHRYRRPGFTVEAGYGENPLPMSGFESIYAELRPLLVESLRL